MVRQSSKTTTTTTETAPATAPVAEVAPKKAGKKSTKTTEPVVEVAPVAPAPVAEVAPVVSTETAPKVELGSVSKIAEIEAMLQQRSALDVKIRTELKGLRKIVEREQKLAQKNSKTSRKQNPNRKPSGFAKPTRISDELAQFLGRAVGTEMARTEVSKEIAKYIKSNNLNDATNKRIIHPDNKLANLLKYKKGDKMLTYFNLQTFMKHHFIKTTPTATA